MTIQTGLTPVERQLILRKLKHGPAMDRATLVRYTIQLREEILKKRKKAWSS